MRSRPLKIEFYTRVTVQDLCVIILTQKLIMIIIDIGVFLGIFSATSETDHLYYAYGIGNLYFNFNWPKLFDVVAWPYIGNPVPNVDWPYTPYACAHSVACKVTRLLRLGNRVYRPHEVRVTSCMHSVSDARQVRAHATVLWSWIKFSWVNWLFCIWL